MLFLETMEVLSWLPVLSIVSESVLKVELQNFSG